MYFVAQGALLQTGAHVRSALDAQRREIGRDLDTVAALGGPEVRAIVEPKARASGMTESGSAAPAGTSVVGAPPPLVGRSGFALVVFGFAFLASASALVAGAGLGRSYARALAQAAAEIRSMGDDAQGVRVEVLDRSRYRDVTELLFAVGELGHLFQRFAIAQNTAAASNVRTERMRAQFLTSMSHDLKAPMNAVLGFAELLSRHPLTPGQAENVHIVKQRGEELLLLIQTVLDSARLEAESFVMESRPQLLEELVREAVQKAAELGNDHDVDVVAELHDEHEIVVDPERLTFALLLLLRTAQRLTSPGLEVYVRTRGHRSLGQVELTIESSGGALAPAELSRIFEAFHYTAEARKFGSLGLGLSLAQSIIALSRGSIEVSAAETGALRIVVRLPTPRDTDPSLA
ncbi:HAMP domain-containing histidine kinase [bacterium]|nr:MAG: HAMP domain-containing histidine kinase [bacterium]